MPFTLETPKKKALVGGVALPVTTYFWPLPRMVFFCCFAKPAARYEADVLIRPPGPPRATASVHQQSQVAPKPLAQLIDFKLEGIGQIANQDASASVIASVVTAAEPKTPITKTGVPLTSHEINLTPSATEDPTALLCAEIADDMAADVVSQGAPDSAHILQPQEPVQLHDLRQASTDTGSQTMAFQPRLSSPASVISDVTAVKEASPGGTQAAQEYSPASTASHMHKSSRPAAGASSTTKNTPRSGRSSSRTPRSSGMLPTPYSAKPAARSGSPAVDQIRTNSPHPSSTSSKGPCSGSASRLPRPTAAAIARAEAVAASKLATATPSQLWKL
eukprot:gene683-981_t